MCVYKVILHARLAYANLNANLMHHYHFTASITTSLQEKSVPSSGILSDHKGMRLAVLTSLDHTRRDELVQFRSLCPTATAQ